MLLDALDQTGIRFTLCKHENAAGFMAEGSWQATGAPGILLTTIGPGLTNAVNSIANALQEQAPLIVLSGCVTPQRAAEFTHQVIDQAALLAPITKAQFQVAPGTAAQIIQQALAIAQADPPGPVHIDLPDSFAQSDTAVLDTPAATTETRDPCTRSNTGRGHRAAESGQNVRSYWRALARCCTGPGRTFWRSARRKISR